ncbi:het-r [Trichoderma arundinaceum]|uniref:Mitochondrial division protein 1 n=1 Tax=Trichoderma arundinaceum TaxID=490622 RepID=A0A395NRI7_TRIAR|nr:het-r [Trichoderma arundinaceum]
MQPNWSACIQTFERHKTNVISVSFSLDNTKLASLAGADTVKIWDLTTGACLQSLESDKWIIRYVVLSPDATQLALAHAEGVEIWHLTTSTYLESIPGYALSVTFSADGARLAILSHDKLTIRDLAANVDLQTYNIPPGSKKFGAVAFPPDHTHLPLNFGRGSGTWDSKTGPHVPTLTDEAFCARLVTSPQQLGRATICDLVNGQCMGAIYGDVSAGEYVRHIALSSGGTRLAVASNENVRIWDLASERLQILTTLTTAAIKMAFSPDGMRLATARDAVEIWDIATGGRLQIFEGHTNTVSSLSFSPDGSLLASGANDSTARVWDMASSTSLQMPDGYNAFALFEYSPNGRLLASASFNGNIKIWDPVTGLCLREFGQFVRAAVLAFSPDGMQLAVGGENAPVMIWDPTTGACLKTMNTEEEDVYLVTFSSSGTQLASVSRHNVMKIWDVTTGDCSHTIDITVPHNDSEITLSSDGTELEFVSADSTVQIWDLSAGTCLHTLERCAVSRYVLLPAELYRVIDLFRRSVDCGNHVRELSISKNEAWILRQQEPVLWLPPEHRPRLFAAHGNFCAIACASSKILCFQFDLDALDEELKKK